MNMKKTLYLVLAICILLASVPMVGFAQGTTDAEQAAAGKVCKIGETYYTTLGDALKAVKDGETVTLISDVKQDSTLPAITAGITVTLNGNGFKLERVNNDKTGTLFGDVKCNLVLDNCNITASGAWSKGQLLRAMQPTGDAISITVRNSTIVLAANFAGEALSDGKTLNILFENSTVTTNNGNMGSFFERDFMGGQKVTITLDRSTLNLYTGKLWTIKGGGSVAKLVLKNGSCLNSQGGNTPFTSWRDAQTVGTNQQSIELYDSEILVSDKLNKASDSSHPLNWTDGEVSLKMDEKSAFRTNRTNATTGQKDGVFLFRIAGGTNLTVELEKGAVIEMNDCGVKDKTKLIWWQGDAKINLIDKGAEWKFGANIQRCGVMMNLPWGARQLGWASADGTRLYSNDKLLNVADATEPLTLKIANYSETDFGNKAGASIRLTDPLGIRFAVNVSSALTAALAGYAGMTVTFGAILAPTAKVTGAFTPEGVGEGNYVITDPAAFRWAVENVDGMNEYRVALVGIPATKSALEMQFSATGFFTVKYADGSTRTFYAAFDQTANSRSLYEVAQAAQAAGITGDAITQILNICQAGNQ